MFKKQNKKQITDESLQRIQNLNWYGFYQQQQQQQNLLNFYKGDTI